MNELTQSPDPAHSDVLTVADLFDEYEEALHRYATRLAGDADGADDLVQETFVRAMGHLTLLGQLNRHQRRAWLYRVLRNRFLDKQRARRRERALAQRLAWRTEVVHDPSLMVLSPDLFEQIPEQYREVLQRRYFLGMTSAEIGRELGIPAATVRSRLHLAIKWLRAHQSELF